MPQQQQTLQEESLGSFSSVVKMTVPPGCLGMQEGVVVLIKLVLGEQAFFEVVVKGGLFQILHIRVAQAIE